MQMIVTACTRRDQHNMTNRTLNSVNPAITTAIAKCLGIYSKSMSAARTHYSIVLSDAGLTDSCMNRLAKLRDTVTHQNLLGKLNAIAKRHKVDMDDWKEFGVVLDNVDVYVKPRKESSEKTNKMHHMVQAIAVEERVSPPADASKAPAINVDSIEPTDVYPSTGDELHLRQLMYTKILEMLTQIPALKDVPVELPSEEHPFSLFTSRKSQQVNSVQNLASD